MSVIIPTKNRRDLVQEALDSVRKQTYQNWEAIVVDDNSTDDTMEVLTALAREDPRIKVFRRTGDRGGAPSAGIRDCPMLQASS